MKKITTFIFALTVVTLSAQTTHNLDWFTGIGSSVDLTIETGDTVIWNWTDALPHTVDSEPGSTETLSSGTLTGIGMTFSHTFTLVGTNDYFCGIHGANSMSGTITVTPALSIDDKFARSVKFYPNPVKNQLNITSLYELDSYEIYDILGKKVGQGIAEGTSAQLNTSYLKVGVYFMKVTSGDLQTSIRFIKK